MVVPGIGEAFVSSRIKIILAVLVAFLMLPILNLPDTITMPQSAVELVLKIAGEITIGFYIGLFLRVIASAVNIIGFVISSATGLSAANMMDPTQSSQGSIIGNFLTITFLVLLFSLNVDHDVISLISVSYIKLPLWSFYDSIVDITKLFIEAVQNSWFIAIRLSLSFLIISFIINISAGLISRLMPQMHVFFVVMPAQIIIGFFVMMISISSILLLFITEYKNYFYTIFG